MAYDAAERLAHFDASFAVLNFLFDRGDYVTDGGFKINGNQFQFGAAEPAVLQQVQQQQIHVFRGSLNATQIVFALSIQAGFGMFAQELGKAADRAQGSAQIVRDRVTEAFELFVDLGEVFDPALQFSIE